MQVHQLLAGASDGDAITSIALATRELLRRYVGAEVYAHHVDASVAGVVRTLDQLPPGDPDDVLVLRASIGDDELAAVLANRPERIVVAYHNITPATFFDALDPAFAALLRAGRDQLRALRPQVVAAYADSAFNAADLAQLGYDDVEVVPPLLDPFRLHDEQPDPAFASDVQRRAPAELVLFVGQLLPHKRPHELIAAHHLLTSYHHPDAALVLVGTPRAPAYFSALARYSATLNLPRVWFTGPLPDRHLAELYRRADVFVTASGHEGFCVPLLEAMAHSVPVVASAAGAIPETAGGAALLVPDGDAATFAESIAWVLDSGDRGGMALAGRARARALAPAEVEPRLVAFLRRHQLLP